MAAEDEALISAARAVRVNAYAPYSRYHVGAAVLDEKGRQHLGCNVENSSYPEGACAEANAIAAMVAQGGRTIRAIAVVGDSGDVSIADGGKVGACAPCGGCRQRILEFSDANTKILFIDADNAIKSCTVDDLLPAAFRVE